MHPKCRCTISAVVESKRQTGKTKRLSNINQEKILPYFIGKTDDSVATLKFYEKQIVNAKIENAVIVTAAGEIYHCTGELNSIDNIEELGEKLESAAVTHNHPKGSANDYTFSDDDFALFEKYGLKILRGIDEKFIYELNRNADDIDFEITDIGELIELNSEEIQDSHKRVGLKALIEGYGYRRWERGN